MSKWVFLILGSSLGGTARYAFSGAIYGAFGSSFPHGTLAVNLTGCLLVGLLDGLGQNRFMLDPQHRILLIIGFCGAFTTFSTLILETSNLMRAGESFRAFMNLGLSVMGGFACLKIGEVLSGAL